MKASLADTNIPFPNWDHKWEKTKRERELFYNFKILLAGAPNNNFRENICLEDDLRSKIFGTFVVKFLACLPLLGFSNI